MFALSEEQRLVIDTAAAFTDDRLRPHAERWDQERTMDRDVLVELCALGFGGLYAGEEHGGSGLGRLEAALVFEQLSKGCVGHASFLTIHNMATWMVDRFGDDALRARFAAEGLNTKLLEIIIADLGRPEAALQAAAEIKARLKGAQIDILIENALELLI